MRLNAKVSVLGDEDADIIMWKYREMSSLGRKHEYLCTYVFIYILAALHSLQDISSPTRGIEPQATTVKMLNPNH